MCARENVKSEAVGWRALCQLYPFGQTCHLSLFLYWCSVWMSYLELSMEYVGAFVALPSQQWRPADLHGLGISRRVSPSPWESVSLVPALGFAEDVLCNPTQREGSSGRLRKALCFCRECRMSSARQLWLCPCALSLPGSLGSAAACTAHSYRNALPGWREC